MIYAYFVKKICRTGNGFWLLVLLTCTGVEMKEILKYCLLCPKWGHDTGTIRIRLLLRINPPILENAIGKIFFLVGVLTMEPENRRFMDGH